MYTATCDQETLHAGDASRHDGVVKQCPILLADDVGHCPGKKEILGRLFIATKRSPVKRSPAPTINIVDLGLIDGVAESLLEVGMQNPDNYLMDVGEIPDL